MQLKKAFIHIDRFQAKAAEVRAFLDRLGAVILVGTFQRKLVHQSSISEPGSILIDHPRAQRVPAPKPEHGCRFTLIVA